MIGIKIAPSAPRSRAFPNSTPSAPPVPLIFQCFLRMVDIRKTWKSAYYHLGFDDKLSLAAMVAREAGEYSKATKLPFPTPFSRDDLQSHRYAGGTMNQLAVPQWSKLRSSSD